MTLHAVIGAISINYFIGPCMKSSGDAIHYHLGWTDELKVLLMLCVFVDWAGGGADSGWYNYVLQNSTTAPAQQTHWQKNSVTKSLASAGMT